MNKATYKITTLGVPKKCNVVNGQTGHKMKHSNTYYFDF